MKIGTKLDFNIMSNPFNIKKLTEKEAIKLIKESGLKIKREKQFKKVVVIYPIGDADKVYNFIESLTEKRIFIENNGIAIK